MRGSTISTHSFLQTSSEHAHSLPDLYKQFSPLFITVWSVRLFKFLTFFGFCSLLINFLDGSLPCDRLSCHCELSMYSVRLTFLRVLHIQSCFGDRLFNVNGSKLCRSFFFFFLMLMYKLRPYPGIDPGWVYSFTPTATA